ncbi:MAG: DNA repair protein RecN [Oscillospiraceae bacterium]|nr:DNA repair protein RecN [Oscillospiraceae bacterium]
MLQELQIENIAVIEKADICFGPGLNVLTGETGAGKSIIIDAIAAVTGARVSRELIRGGEEKASVTAVFDRQAADAWLAENEIDADGDELILQRRITRDGKSSCRVCGCPVSLSQMHALGEQLLELHGQNDGLKLLDERRHLAALDAFGDIDINVYFKAYEKLCAIRDEQKHLRMDEAEKEHRQILLSDTVKELERAAVAPGETEELSARRNLLRNSEKLTEALQSARACLGEDGGAVSMTQEAVWHCRHASGFAPELSDAGQKLEQAAFLLTDADELLRDFQEALNFSPDEYDRLEERLREISRLERKYRHPADELSDYLESCRRQLEEISSSDERLRELEQEEEKQSRLCTELASELHRKRLQAGKLLAEKVEKELHELSMPSARFQTEVTDTGKLSGNGSDEVRFLLSANRGEELGRISRIASGGELSRIMLAMKSVLSRGDPVPTMIFDEIDTGVSGIAAQRVGEHLAGLSQEKQVLCVTHLPQIAAMADRHYVILKNESGERTLTEVELLGREGKRQELARLHGGDHITETTLLSAEEQLQYAEKFKSGNKQ